MGNIRHADHALHQAAFGQRHLAAHAVEQTAVQRRRHPLPIDPRCHIAARALGDFARFVPQHGVQQMGRRRKTLVMRTAAGFKAHKLAVRLCQRGRRQLQIRQWRRRAAHLHPAVEQTVLAQGDTYAPHTAGVGGLDVLQGELQSRVVEGVAKMLRRCLQTLHMPRQVAKVPCFQRQGGDDFKAHTHSFHKCTLGAPFLPFPLRMRAGSDAAANTAAQRLPGLALHHHGANRHVKGGTDAACAVRMHHPQRPTVPATRLGLQRSNGLHGGPLGCARDRATRKQGFHHL